MEGQGLGLWEVVEGEFLNLCLLLVQQQLLVLVQQQCQKHGLPGPGTMEPALWFYSALSFTAQH